MRLLVIGIGQSMRGDDAAGLEVVKLWQARHPDTAAQVQVEFSELPGLTLLDMLEGKDAAILVDAVQSPTSSGEVFRLGVEELASFSTDAGSAHGWGVAEALQMGHSLVPSLAMCEITLIGIPGVQFGMGEGLSPQVNEVVEKAVDMIEMEINNYLIEKKR
jgi:hydrogenase maturation protease